MKSYICYLSIAICPKRPQRYRSDHGIRSGQMGFTKRQLIRVFEVTATVKARRVFLFP